MKRSDEMLKQLKMLKIRLTGGGDVSEDTLFDTINSFIEGQQKGEIVNEPVSTLIEIINDFNAVKKTNGDLDRLKPRLAHIQDYMTSAIEKLFKLYSDVKALEVDSANEAKVDKLFNEFNYLIDICIALQDMLESFMSIAEEADIPERTTNAAAPVATAEEDEEDDEDDDISSVKTGNNNLLDALLKVSKNDTRGTEGTEGNTETNQAALEKLSAETLIAASTIPTSVEFPQAGGHVNKYTPEIITLFKTLFTLSCICYTLHNIIITNPVVVKVLSMTPDSRRALLNDIVRLNNETHLPRWIKTLQKPFSKDLLKHTLKEQLNIPLGKDEDNTNLTFLEALEILKQYAFKLSNNQVDSKYAYVNVPVLKYLLTTLQDYVNVKYPLNLKYVNLLNTHKDQIDAEYYISNAPTIITYVRFRKNESELSTNARFNVMVNDNGGRKANTIMMNYRPDSYLKYSLATSENKQLFLESINTQNSALEGLEGTNMKIDNPEEFMRNVQNNNLTNHACFQYHYGPFTRVFAPNETNRQIASKCTEITKSLIAGNTVFVLGYGSSGAGKTSTLVYRAGASDSNKEGIIVHILKSPEMTHSFERVNMTVFEFMADTKNPLKVFKTERLSDDDNDTIRPQHPSYPDFGTIKTKNLATNARHLSFSLDEKGCYLQEDFEYTNAFQKDKDTKLFAKSTTNIGEVISWLVDEDRLVAATSNNPQSSRSHVLIELELVGEAANKTGFLFVGDFAGLENEFNCAGEDVLEWAKIIRNGRKFYDSTQIMEDIQKYDDNMCLVPGSSKEPLPVTNVPIDMEDYMANFKSKEAALKSEIDTVKAEISRLAGTSYDPAPLIQELGVLRKQLETEQANLTEIQTNQQPTTSAELQRLEALIKAKEADITSMQGASPEWQAITKWLNEFKTLRAELLTLRLEHPVSNSEPARLKNGEVNPRRITPQFVIAENERQDDIKLKVNTLVDDFFTNVYTKYWKTLGLGDLSPKANGFNNLKARVLCNNLTNIYSFRNTIDEAQLVTDTTKTPEQIEQHVKKLRTLDLKNTCGKTFVNVVTKLKAKSAAFEAQNAPTQQLIDKLDAEIKDVKIIQIPKAQQELSAAWEATNQALKSEILTKISGIEQSIRSIQNQIQGLGATKDSDGQLLIAAKAELLELQNKLIELNQQKAAIKAALEKACSCRVYEGKFINSSVLKMRDDIISSVIEANGQQSMPEFLRKCSPYQCNPVINNCFKKKDKSTNMAAPGPIGPIMKYIKSRQDAPISICIFTVVNLSKSANDPPSLPYIDLRDLRFEYDRLKSLNTGNLMHLATLRGANANMLIDSMVERYLRPRVANIVWTADNIFKNELNEKVLQKCKSWKKYFKGVNPTSFSAADDAFIDGRIDQLSQNQFIKANILPPLLELIEYIDTINSVSVLGTMEFTDLIAKYDRASTECSHVVGSDNLIPTYDTPYYNANDYTRMAGGAADPNKGEVELEDLIGEFTKYAYPNVKPNDTIKEFDLSKKISFGLNQLKPSAIIKRMGNRPIGTGTIDRVAKQINMQRSKYITEMYKDGKMTYDNAQDLMEAPRMENARFETSKKRMAANIMELLMLFPESQHPRVLDVILPTVFSEYDIPNINELVKIDDIRPVQPGGGYLGFAVNKQLLTSILNEYFDSGAIAHRAAHDASEAQRILEQLTGDSNVSYQQAVAEAGTLKQTASAAAAAATAAEANVKANPTEKNVEAALEAAQRADIAAIDARAAVMKAIVAAIKPLQVSHASQASRGGAAAAKNEVARICNSYYSSIREAEGENNDGMKGGGADVASDIPVSPMERSKELIKKLGEANTKWRDLKANFDEVKSNITSFHRWLMNTDENGYDAFKTTYTATWLKKFTDFEAKSRKDVDDIRASLDVLIDKEGGFSEEKKNGFIKSLGEALNDNAKVTPDSNLASLYKKYINTVMNLYEQTKAFFGKYETLVNRNNKLLEAQRAQGQGKYGVAQAIEIPTITFTMPLELIRNFSEIIPEANANAATMANRNLERAKDAATKAEKKLAAATDALGKAITADKPKFEAAVAAAETAKEAADKEVTAQEKLVPAAAAAPAAGDAAKPDIATFISQRSAKLDEVFTSVGGALKIRGSPALALTANENMFAKILNEYLTKKDMEPEAEFTAREKLVETLHANKLVPNQVLKVNKMDKVVFVFLTLFMRLLCLSLIEYLIERGNIKTITAATFGFFGLYTFVFIAFTMMVNLDMYRLRIVFNMLNMHANGGYVYMHLGMLWLFGGFIYMVLSNLNVFGVGVKITAINEYEKQVLISKLELLTLIVWTLLTIVIVLM